METGDSAKGDNSSDAKRKRIEDARRRAERDHSPQLPSSTTRSDSHDSRESAFDTVKSDSFAGYHVVREIHRGGQGVVYQAIHESTRRKVAIKVLKEGSFSSAAERMRFEREIQILGQLQHPNIVAIHDSGEADGHFYFVMDYISGRALDDYLVSAELTLERSLELFAKICEAVNSAHLRGIIHRDLKPGNIRIDPNGEPHLLDFGLAKIAVAAPGAETGEPALMTMTGQFLGSLAWASPEQAEGVPSKIDVRTDVYSLGVILYRMLTGEFPYDVSGNIHEVVENILRTAPARPSTIRRQINDEVETIVLKCMAKERERRYQSAGELARDLRHYLADEPIEAKRDSAWYVLSKTLRRYRVPAAVGLLFFIVAIAFGVFMTVMYRRAVRAEVLAKARLERVERSEAEVRELLADSYLQTARLAVQRREWETALENYARALQSGYGVEIVIRLERIETLVALGQIGRAVEELESLSERADLGLFRGPVLLWQADMAMTRTHEWPYALELAERASAAGLNPDDEAYARALRSERTPEAVALLEQALRLNPNHHRANDLLAKLLFTLGRLDEARARLHVLKGIYPKDLNIRALLAIVYTCQGELTAGRAMVDELEPQLGRDLAEAFRGVLDLIDGVNRVGAGTINPSGFAGLIETGAQLLRQLLPHYRVPSYSGAATDRVADQLAFGARLPPFLVRETARGIQAVGLALIGRTEAAAEQFGLVVKAHPEGLLYLFHGVLLFEAGRLVEAEEAFRLSAQTPSLLDWRRLALWHAAGTQWVLAGVDGTSPDLALKARAVETVRTLVSLGDLGPQLASTAARIAIGAGEFDLARSILTDWQRRDATDPRALRLRILAEYKAGAYGPAITAADALLAVQPDDSEALELKGLALDRLRSLLYDQEDSP